MFKNNQVWMITFLDLTLLMICFFVLFYALNLSEYNKSKGEVLFNDSQIQTSSLNQVGNLQIIYNNLQSHYSNDRVKKIEFNKDKRYIRINNNADIFDINSLEKEGKELSSDIYNFSKNQIRIKLLLNLSNRENFQGNKSEIELRNMISNFNKFRNIVAENSNIDTISSIIEIDYDYPLEKGKDWVIVTDILPEQN